jgi:hypothetical protein
MKKHSYNISNASVYLEIIHKFKFQGNKTVNNLHVSSSAEVSYFTKV